MTSNYQPYIERCLVCNEAIVIFQEDNAPMCHHLEAAHQTPCTKEYCMCQVSLWECEDDNCLCWED